MQCAALAANVLALGVTQASQLQPFSFDTVAGQLPKDVVPLNYRIRIVPNAAAATLTGSESVQLRFRSATDKLQFNSLGETLSNVQLDGKPVKAVASDDTKQVTSVSLRSRAAPGTHTLSFSYRGKIDQQPQGLFVQSYSIPGGEHGLLLATQMEPTDARRMFPCWDEPAFRARFELTAVIPARWSAVSNMPVARRTVRGDLASVTFQTTPSMPSYLVAFVAGDIASISAEHDGHKFAVWAVRGQQHNGQTALANAQQILSDYDDYFGYRYPLPKLDSIAVPGGFGGAMENWGAITYNEQLLLLTPQSTIGDRQSVYSVQAHEMAHQWNGDLVTMGWWDDIWLNESFASWRAAKETALRNPSWKWWESEDASRERAMAADARQSSHPIQQHVSDELQVKNAFDPEITYDKGQSVLRMLEAFIGADAFRDGIRSYIKAHAYSNATTLDLWQALTEASHQNIGGIAGDWTEQGGFPLVQVTAICDGSGGRTLILSQQRFLLRGTDPANPTWRVPLQLRSGTTEAPRSVLLSQDGQTVSAGRCDQPLSADADAIGFYRVRYDQATFKLNVSHFAELPDADRIALLDDQWALVEADQQPLASFLTLATSMGDSLDTRAWQQVATALAVIEYDERDSPGHDAFSAYARSIVQSAAARLGWDAKPDEGPDVQELRRTLIGDLGAWGDPQIIAEARRRFDAFVKDQGTLSPDDQAMVLSIVMRNADEATFAQVHAMAKAARDQAELERYYTALTRVRDPQLASQVVQIALSSELPPQSKQLPLQLVLSLARDHPQLAWSAFTDNLDPLLAQDPMFKSLIIAQYVPQVFWNALPPEQLESWVRAHVPAEMSDNVDRGMESARFLASEKQSLVPATDSYVKSSAAGHAG
jgi:aminopeptidase N